MTATRYVALLRGINVGGKNLIRMPNLAAAFSDAGHRDVSTYIQSGNVLFTATASDGRKLEASVEKMLHEKFGAEGRCRLGRARARCHLLLTG